MHHCEDNDWTPKKLPSFPLDRCSTGSNSIDSVPTTPLSLNHKSLPFFRQSRLFVQIDRDMSNVMCTTQTSVLLMRVARPCEYGEILNLLAKPSHVIYILNIKSRPLREMRSVLHIGRPPLSIGMSCGVALLEIFLLLFLEIREYSHIL